MFDLEWDEGKRRSNLIKHGVDFAGAERFNWDNAIEFLDDRGDYGEERWTAIGWIDDGIHVLTYTERDQSLRVISLRKATNEERRRYAKETR